MSRTHLPFYDGDALELPWREAIGALSSALRSGKDLSAQAQRSVVDVENGQLLLMPAESGSAVGFKLASVAPENPRHGLPRIQALYVLLDAETLTPMALLDGTTLTAVRTPALSALVVDRLTPHQHQHHVIFGTGVQARGHAHALAAVRPAPRISVVSRNTERGNEFAQRLQAEGLPASSASPECVTDADVVVCATSSAHPVFNGLDVKNGACVIAVGSHQPSVREVDEHFVRRAAKGSGVVVETRDVAIREAGDIVQAIQSGDILYEDLTELQDAISSPLRQDGDLLFKSCGMGWQDLAIAEAILYRKVMGS